MVTAKLKKKYDTVRDTEKAPQESNNWATLILTMGNPEGNGKICGVYKIRVDYQIWSDLFSSPDMETASHEFTRMKYFAEIHLKSAYNLDWQEIQENNH